MDEFTKVIGCRRKPAIRLLYQENQIQASKKLGCPHGYGATLPEIVKAVWEATDRLCSKRLHPFLPDLVMVPRRHDDTAMTVEIEVQLCQMSPCTIGRLL